ncbi:DUF4388 domain-containing protein [uncultured Deinococcus sp.]|uniref:DUF4388 domain-containing protein n=1 Tax=uncultured Deinococcus sp. TaxID=158789 RepID=UPI0025891041|nr:DUF4388 domain-containing protein [uncultured Deinococcus sp.]
MVSGDLSVFPFLPVMQMLLSSGRGGRLTVEHARGGSLWFAPGELLHAHSGALDGPDALQLLSSLDAGTFFFVPDEPAPQRTLNLRADQALVGMLGDQEAWSTLLRVFPEWGRPLRLSGRWNDQQPVTRAQYRLLNLVRQNLTLRELIDRAGLPPRGALDTLRPFMAGGLIEVG